MPSATVPFMDLSPQWDRIRDAVMPDMERLFAASAFCLGDWVSDFEARIGDYLGAAHAVAVSSGSAALHLAVVAGGIGRGDKVLVPSNTFVGTVWGLIYAGAVPIFCDVESATGTIDMADTALRMEEGVRAIIPVHLYGQPADMDAVASFAREHDLMVIEDAAQAIGARHGGRAVGTIGRMGCFSFYPGKNLGGAGEGGLIITDDAEDAALLRALRDHGQSQRYVHDRVGFNYRMDGIQGLVLGHKLPLLDEWTDQRRMLAARYQLAFAGLPLNLPTVVHYDHVFHLYVVRSETSEALRAHLADNGIATGRHYPIPLHRQPCFADLPTPIRGFPVTEDFAANGISLPLFAGMTIDQQDRVINAVTAFFQKDPYG
ncbi:DegT/DnrJ/EryC1/StrS aminotransferase family protein [Sphingobium sp. CR2-8]|uniref:DegT/DnrJ/EryC1/StrS family aminotransferase n=1 Tax=Sphingobium sp. CR2-8 TaxID=1306534 RepID=UPI002DBDAAE2|nr:DegT/DnrJ/EryC1/StrS aminotransferase family protein [Sphingobium sp. CR2-8]MEC3909147.1 DegT/DnrJ/EryC1/StrS aminotransferase family protein [Sphingobium sp. CR2-8]